MCCVICVLYVYYMCTSVWRRFWRPEIRNPEPRFHSSPVIFLSPAQRLPLDNSLSLSAPAADDGHVDAHGDKCPPPPTLTITPPSIYADSVGVNVGTEGGLNQRRGDQ